MAFEISPVTDAADFPRLMDVQFSAFEGDPVHAALNGLDTPENRAAAARRAVKEWQSDPHQVTVKATRKDTGEIVAFGQWKIYATERPESEWKKREPFDWLEERQRELAEGYFGAFYDGRERFWGGRPYCLLAFLATHPKYQRQGAGTAIVKWGIDRANELGISAYLEATKPGEPLYKKLGFRRIGEAVMKKEKWGIDHDLCYPCMVWGKTPDEYE